MFEDSLVTASAPARSGGVPVASLMSMCLQVAIAAAICIAPLFHPLRLGMHAPPAPLFVPILRQTPPHVKVQPAAAATAGPASPTLPTIAAHLHAAQVPETSLPTPGFTASLFALSGPPEAALRGSEGGRAVSAGPNGGDAGGGTARRGPVRVSSGVSAGLLLSPIRPVYPHIAQAARVEGTVMVSAVISRVGTVVQAHVVSGPPMLAKAALDAVQAARYRPFQLNGEPTEVETTFSIVFRLGSM